MKLLVQQSNNLMNKHKLQFVFVTVASPFVIVAEIVMIVLLQKCHAAGRRQLQAAFHWFAGTPIGHK